MKLKMYNLSLKELFKEAGYQHDDGYASSFVNNSTISNNEGGGGGNSLGNQSRDQLEDKLKRCENVCFRI